MSRAVIYVRVSSKEQRDEGYSIPAQKKLLEEYARARGFEVVAEFEDAETAKRAGRREFERMLRFLRKRKDVGNILVEKTDRLARNFRDYVDIGDLGRDVHYVKEGQVMGPNARAAGKLIHDIKLALAKNYVDNLSEETRKGMLEKAEQGLYPSFAPLGYLNDRDSGRIVVDFERAHHIRRMFEQYAAGASVREVGIDLWELGFRSRKGKRVANSMLPRMLRNPIYTGDFEWGGKYYRGKHDPIISRELFDAVQTRFADAGKPRPSKHKFAFRGLLKCGVCGCSITAERKKGRYVYYRCTHMRGNCTEKPIGEEKLAKLLGAPLKRLRITDERLEWIIKALRESHQDEKEFKQEEQARLEKELAELRPKMDAAYEDKLAGVISEKFWQRKHREYRKRQERLRALVAEHDFASGDYLEDGVRILELAKDAYRLYVRQDSFEQRKMLDILYSNCTMAGGKVQAEQNEVFQILADGAEQEAKMRKRGASKKARNEKWLPE